MSDVTSSFIGWTHALNDLCDFITESTLDLLNCFGDNIQDIYIFAFSIISQHLHGTGNQNPSSWKEPLILKSISWLLPTWQWKGARASAAMVSV